MFSLRNSITTGIKGIQKGLHKFKDNKDLNIAIRNAKNINNEQLGYYQNNILNFYDSNHTTPYVPISAKGPWVVTSNGAIVYDVGGYGILGFGHSPQWCLNILGKDHVMANVMTPNKYQYKLTKLLLDIGKGNGVECPYSYFSFLNSGSESIELSKRIVGLFKKDDKRQKATIVLKNGFHGRTTLAAQLSDSSYSNYAKHLGSLNMKGRISLVEVNNLEDFNTKFNYVNSKYNLDSVYMEPVMGEGNPGVKLERDFYQLVREKTKKNNVKLVIDSVQACLRATGYLSIVDYPWLKGLDGPDMEIFSKAITAGQFPLSILAVNNKIQKKFKPGIYGNTYTGNPKALDLCYHTLLRVDDDVRDNIVKMGYKFKNMLLELKEDHYDIIDGVTGTGLLIAMSFKDNVDVDSKFGLEFICRKNGLNVIHGGKNALRFTPHFLIDEDEIELIKLILNKSIIEIKLGLYFKNKL